MNSHQVGMLLDSFPWNSLHISRLAFSVRPSRSRILTTERITNRHRGVPTECFAVGFLEPQHWYESDMQEWCVRW